MKHILAIIIVLSLLSISYGFNEQRSIDINSFDIPYEGEFNFTFRLQENQTLFFNITNASPELEFFFDEQHTLNGTDRFNFTLNYQLNQRIVSNRTLNAELLVTNTLNSQNYTALLEFNVIRIDSLFRFEPIDELRIVDNEYVYRISILDLTRDGELSFNIQGNPGERFNVSGCEGSRFLRCEDFSFSIPQSQNYVLTIPYQLSPTPLGDYKDSFRIESQRIQRDINITFEVRQPDIFLVPQDIQECFLEEPSLRERFICEERLAEYRLETLIVLNEYFASINTQEICEQFIETEFVIGDTISDIVMNQFTDLQNDFRDLRRDNEALNRELSMCRLEKQDLSFQFNSTIAQKDNEITTIREQNLLRQQELTEQLQVEKESYKERNTRVMLIVSFIIWFFTLILVGFKFIMNAFFLNPVRGINYTIIGSIGIVFFLGWIVLLIFA